MVNSRIKQKTLITLRRFLNEIGVREKKVFAIGYNKCGTTSLHALFKTLGLPSYHGVGWRSCQDLKLLRSYDCFSDGIPKDLAKLDGMFPGSKFILQVRDLDSWVYSRLAHIERTKKLGTYHGTPEWDDTEYAVKTWIRERNSYHLSVLSYFSERPSDILVVNFVRDESAATKICNFLGYNGSFERGKKNVNPNKKIPGNHIEMLGACAAELGIDESELRNDIYCPSLVVASVDRNFPSDSTKV